MSAEGGGQYVESCAKVSDAQRVSSATQVPTVPRLELSEHAYFLDLTQPAVRLGVIGIQVQRWGQGTGRNGVPPEGLNGAPVPLDEEIVMRGPRSFVPMSRQRGGDSSQTTGGRQQQA